ncbi:MAG: histidine phosphatase family protein [Kiloniellales bacterium]
MILIRHGQSEFNVVFGPTRRDPGIVDPKLTAEGERQAAAAAETLVGRGFRRVIASPYTRALHTAEIVAERLGLPVSVEPLVRERYAYTCDIGSPRSALTERWSRVDFGDLPERWWHRAEEPEADLLVRCRHFHQVMARAEDWRQVVVVSHWGFIRGLTGLEVANCQQVSFEPSLLEGA